jgi:hypothetical protein
MKNRVSVPAAVAAIALIGVEAGGVWFGGWGRGHITHEGVMGGCTGCIFLGSTVRLTRVLLRDTIYRGT